MSTKEQFSYPNKNSGNFLVPNFVSQSYDSAHHFSKPIFSPCGNLRSHFDGVRDI